MTISHPPTHTPVRTTGDAPAAQAVGLADEHGQLLRQVAIRTDALLAAAASGGWPAEELHALLGYLSTEVLRQAADEEAFLFPARAGSGTSRLARDYARLRSGIEALQRAADGGSLAVLASVTRDLLFQLEHHLAAEEAILAGPDGTGRTPATAALSGHPHEWYPLTEGPVIDLDALPRGPGRQGNPRSRATAAPRRAGGAAVQQRPGSRVAADRRVRPGPLRLRLPGRRPLPLAGPGHQARARVSKTAADRIARRSGNGSRHCEEAGAQP